MSCCKITGSLPLLSPPSSSLVLDNPRKSILLYPHHLPLSHPQGSLSNSLSSPEDPPPGIYCPWYLLLTRYHCFTPGLYLRTPWKATPPPGSLSGWLISSTTQAGTAKTFSVDPCPQVGYRPHAWCQARFFANSTSFNPQITTIKQDLFSHVPDVDTEARDGAVTCSQFLHFPKCQKA